IDEERLRLAGAGHQHAIAVKDASASRVQDLSLMLLSLGALDGLLAAIRLQKCDACGERDESATNDGENKRRADGGKSGHRISLQSEHSSAKGGGELKSFSFYTPQKSPSHFHLSKQFVAAQSKMCRNGPKDCS